MYFFTPYRKETGEVMFTSGFSCEEDSVEENYAHRLNALGGSEYDFVEYEVNPLTHYIVTVNGETKALERPNLRVSVNKTTIVSDGVDFISLNGLPIPCEIIKDQGELEEEKITVMGGGFVFTAENPGKYQFKIDRFPFMPLNLEFAAT